MHRLTSSRARLLAASLLASLALGACGSSSPSSSHTASAAGTATSASPASTTSTSAAAASTGDAPSISGVSLNQLNDKLKHLTPQQVAQIKAKLPLYVKAQQACIKQVGSDATQVLGCLHQHGF